MPCTMHNGSNFFVIVTCSFSVRPSSILANTEAWISRTGTFGGSYESGTGTTDTGIHSHHLLEAQKEL